MRHATQKFSPEVFPNNLLKGTFYQKDEVSQICLKAQLTVTLETDYSTKVLWVHQVNLLQNVGAKLDDQRVLLP